MKINTFRENWLICLGIWGEAELFLGIWGAKVNAFRETRQLFAGIRGDECIIFRDQESTDPPRGLISAFVIRFLGSITKLATCRITMFKQVSGDE